MKKIFAVSVLAALAIAGCKKKEVTVSELHNYSKPTIVLLDGNYYSIPVGGILPTIRATAYDSFYHKDATVVFDVSKLDNTEPGIYPVTATAKNEYGMAGTQTIWVAVTNIAATPNLAGRYVREATNDTMMLTRLANGFYRTSDAAGNGISDTTFVIPAYFVQTAPAALIMPAQDSKFGTFYGTNGFINMTASDTTYEYILHNNSFSPTIRVFKKIN